VDPLRTIAPGEPFQPSASRENAWTAAARWVRDRQVSIAGGGTSNLEPGMILVRNDSGADRGPYNVLGISETLILKPSTTKSEFYNRFILSGVEPADAHKGKFVVVVDGIADGKIGRAWAYGFAYVQVNVTDVSHKYAEVIDEDASKLKSAASGNARMLAKETGTGTKWALVRLGGDGSGGGVQLASVVSGSGQMYTVRPNSNEDDIQAVYIPVGVTLPQGSAVGVVNETFSIAGMSCSHWGWPIDPWYALYRCPTP
jgi:hypothetical protein